MEHNKDTVSASKVNDISYQKEKEVYDTIYVRNSS